MSEIKQKTRANIIRNLDKLRLAKFLSDIQNETEKYPRDTMGWLDWLNQYAKSNKIDKL